MIKRIFFALLFSSFSLLACAQTYKPGDPVSILWKGSWYPGKILEANANLYKVSYDGYGAEWNEFVTKDRVKPQNDRPSGPDSYLPTSNSLDASYKGVETIWDIDQSSDGKFIYAASAYGKVIILNAGDLSLAGEINAGKGPLQAVSVSSDGLYLAAGQMQGSLFIYKKGDDGKYAEWLSVPDYFSIARLRFAPTGYQLAVSGAPKDNYKNTQVDIWNTEKKIKEKNLVRSTNDQCMYSDISWSANGSMIALGISNAKRGIEVYDVASGKLDARITHTSDVVSCVFSPDGKTIAGGGTDQKVTLWNVSTKMPVWKYTWGKSGVDYVYGIAFSADGKYVAVCGTGTGRSVDVLESSTGKVEKVAGSSNPGGNAIRFSNDGSSVFVAFTTYGDIAKVAIVQKFGVN